MIYYALMQGKGEGCDYTIACNKDYIKLESVDLETAKEELKEYLSSEPEDGYKEVILLECSKEIKKIFDQPEWSDEI